MTANFDFWKLLAGLGIFLFGMFLLEDSIKTLSGKERWVKINGIILHDLTGTKIGVLLDFEDITDKMKAEKDQRKYTKELEKMNKFMIGRELEMVNLKKEIDELLAKLGLPKKYNI